MSSDGGQSCIFTQENQNNPHDGYLANNIIFDDASGTQNQLVLSAAYGGTTHFGAKKFFVRGEQRVCSAYHLPRRS